LHATPLALIGSLANCFSCERFSLSKGLSGVAKSLCRAGRAFPILVGAGVSKRCAGNAAAAASVALADLSLAAFHTCHSSYSSEARAKCPLGLCISRKERIDERNPRNR